jgi:hypothetical protein
MTTERVHIENAEVDAVAREAEVAPSTVARYLAGLVVRPSSARRIERTVRARRAQASTTT